ncbi:phospholipase C [Effusibacillus dendaii]|uniref:Phospholipase C n=1 Tax=Effusibacillus dendaii TaxID=2743772 RepID=A0A7I8D646_9BACL|nr:alkaline phosphatase family protein [Effusibacillus dendaii]BCJ85565.1 hypothetical protein skT53_05500 [Effusibacillus dendaii]
MKKWLRKKTLATVVCSFSATASFGFSPVQAATETSSPIKHTVVIFQENRSFDNYFGTYPTAPGFHALPGTPKDVKNIPAGAFNPDENGNPVYPYLFPLDQLQTKDVDHGFDHMMEMVDGGKMDKFYLVNNRRGAGKIAMGYYDYHAIPAYWQYAQHFALADNFFQPVYGPSTPGALYLVAAQSGTKDQPIKGDPTPKNEPYGGDNPKSALSYNLTYKNIGDTLSEHNKTWAWYQGGYTANDNTYSPHHNPFQYFQNYEDGKYKNNLKDTNDFVKDIANGKLPDVSFLKAGYPEDEHPGYSTPEGEDFTVKMINAIMNSPYWKDTAIIVTYDESGGYWDHVAPPQVTPGPDGLQGNGPRIPALVISPYAKENYVSHVPYDTTSILKFIEWNYHLPTLNNRDASANNILDMFDFNHPNFAAYMYNDGSLTPAKTYGTPVKVQLNNALLGVSTPGEAPFIDTKGNVMVPLVDFVRSINGRILGNNNENDQNNDKNQNNNQNENDRNAQNDGAKDEISFKFNGKPVHLKTQTWVSPTKQTYVPLKSLVDALGWSMQTENGVVTVTSK